MPKEKRIGGFEVFNYADISTGHTSDGDMQLVEEGGAKLPGVIAVYEQGWFIYVPQDDFEAHQEELEKAGFSKAYITVITALYFNSIPYARFDADGGTHPRLPAF